MRDPKRKQVAIDANAPTDTISFIKYDVAVREGKEIIANEKRGQMRLGELADKLEPKYADRTLAKFAAEIGIAACTLERHRSVYRAWKENPAPGPVSYAVLRALQDHPDRADIVKNNPDLTQAEARKLMRPYRGEDSGKQDKEEQETDWDKHNRRWFKNLVALAHDATSAAEVALDCTPEKQRELLKAVEPGLVMYLRGGGNALVRIADWLDERLEEAKERRAKAEEASVAKKREHRVEAAQATA